MPPGYTPFFLVGCPRSGTTLLRRLLDSHSAIAVAPETFFVRRIWRPRGRGPWRLELPFEQVVRRLVASPAFEAMGLDAASFERAAAEGRQEGGAVLELLLRCWATARRVRIVGEKTPNHALFVRLLERVLPEARFLHIVRDPRAVVASWSRVPWSTGSFEGDALVWRRYARAVRRRGPRDARKLLTVRYEELVTAPEKTLREVCSFLGTRFEPGMLHETPEAWRGVDLEREPWKAGALRPPDPAALDRWRRELGRGEIVAVEAIVGREMRCWGYEPESRPAARRRAAPGAWATALGRQGIAALTGGRQ